ncbi:unnamed protein product [Caenorhabditis angaria]|uniref:Uncharacterized protein n=1 Tax=Caenorhabditis angaria TaxID=860376 RepID=A0A9P1IRS9_9PELO|nr:unnamed protein product [Caenorhabditis angaria]
MNDYTQFLEIFKIYTILSYLDVILSLPIYIYSIFYMLSKHRAQKHLKTSYRYILLSKIVINFLFEQFSSGLATIWFSPIQVSCPTGCLLYLNIPPPIIWQSIAMCLNHALPVSITHLYLYRLKLALRPNSCAFKLLDRGGTIYIGLLYLAGFLVHSYSLMHSGTDLDRIEYAQVGTVPG